MLLSRSKIKELFEPAIVTKLVITDKALVKYSKKAYLVNVLVKDKFITKPEYNQDGLIIKPKSTYLLLEDYIQPVCNIHYVYYYFNHMFDTNQNGFKELLK